MLKEIFSGFAVKLVTGLDDTVTHVPIISSITRTKRGKFAFSFGILAAITVAIILSFTFATILKSFNYYHYIATAVIFFLAFSIQFNLFLPNTKKKTQVKLKRTKKPISIKRIAKLFSIGFIAAFVTVIDDSLAYSSLFIVTENVALTIFGIYLATFLQLTALVYFSKKIEKIAWKKEASVIGLIIIGLLILFRVI